MNNQNKFKLGLLDSFSLMLGIHMILVVYVISSFLEDLTASANVEKFYVIGNLISLVVILNLHRLVNKFGRSKVFIFSLFLCLILLVLISFLGMSNWNVLFLVFFLAISPVIWVGLDLLVEKFSTDRTTGATRGKFLTMCNIGCLVGPFFAMKLIDLSGGYSLTFLLSAIFVLIVLILAAKYFPDVDHRINHSISNWQVIKKILKRKNIARIYYISFLLDFFYAATVVYMPIYLQQQGLSWTEIGKIFTVMLIPFVLLQYPLGRLADKRSGEKEWLILAILIMAVSTCMISFLNSAGILVWMMVLFSTRIGAAMVEILRDSYFFKQIGPADVDINDFYRTTKGLAYIVAMTFFGIFLLSQSLQSVFIVLGLILLTGLFPLFALKDTK